MKQYRSVLATGILFLLLPLSALAQSLSLTAPQGNTLVQEGDDFATTELGNAWDFNQRRDIGWEENFAGPSISAQGGVWSGTNASPGGYLFPLFPGFKGSLFSEGLSNDKFLPRFGINHRINAAKYTRLAYRLNHSDRGTYAVYWESDANRPEYWPDPNSPRGASFDGFYHWNQAYKNAGFTLYSHDLTASNTSFEQRQGTWSNDPFALRIDPSVGGAAGASTQLDWIRLVDPNSAPQHTIQWSSQGVPAQAVVTVYLDDNNSGFDGTPMVRFTSGHNPGHYTFPSAILPPGTYYFYIEARSASGGSFSANRTLSNYSGALIVTAKPSVVITAPSMTSGEEYARDVLGNAWDMDGEADLANLNAAVWPTTFRQFITHSFAAFGDAEDAGRVFQAQADPTLSGASESDVQVHLAVSKSAPIDTAKFKYLSYRIAVDEIQYPTIADKVRHGWVMRPIWWNNSFSNNHHRAKAHVLYEGWNTYATDLSDASIMEYGSPWKSSGSFNNLRLDPLETPVFTWFFLDYVRLHAENRAANGSYTIEFEIEDRDSSQVSAELYYDTDNSGFDGTRFATLNNLRAGSHEYVWDTSALPLNHSFFVYIVLNDGINTSRAYSLVHVKTGAYQASPRTAAVHMDFDGDGRSDQTVYRPATGTLFQNKSSQGTTAAQWGGANFAPIYGDFDADNISDRGLIVSLGGRLHWYVIRSSDGLLYSRVWGLRGDKIVIGDYNGNGADEIAVFRAGVWYVLDENDQATARYWGLPNGDEPVPGDFDGDGKTDLAIWRVSDGVWWILYSGFEQGTASTYFSATQWGIPWIGDYPVTADFTGDGKSEIGVFRPSDGNWYIQDIFTGQLIVQQWGLPGDVPVVGDFNGDGVQDFTVYRAQSGMWYHNFRNGQSAGVQFGLAHDLLPQKVIR